MLLSVAKSFWPHFLTLLSVAKCCLTFCDPMNCSTPSFLCLSLSPVVCPDSCPLSLMTSNHLILCHPLLLLPSVFPNMRVFSNESDLHIRWPKYWSFSFSISPSNKYSGLISFRIDWFDHLTLRGTLKSLLQHHSSKASSLQCSTFLFPYILFTTILPIHSCPPKVAKVFHSVPPLHILFLLPSSPCLPN